MISTVRLTRKDDSEDNKYSKTNKKHDLDAYVSLLQICHLLTGNGVECKFHRKRSKMSMR